MRKKKLTQQERIKALEKRQMVIVQLINDLYDLKEAKAPAVEEE